jgi:hypothetical protein
MPDPSSAEFPDNRLLNRYPRDVTLSTRHICSIGQTFLQVSMKAKRFTSG